MVFHYECPIGETPDKCLAGVCEECYAYRRRQAVRDRWMAFWICIFFAVSLLIGTRYLLEWYIGA